MYGSWVPGSGTTFLYRGRGGRRTYIRELWLVRTEEQSSDGQRSRSRIAEHPNDTRLSGPCQAPCSRVNMSGSLPSSMSKSTSSMPCDDVFDVTLTKRFMSSSGAMCPLVGWKICSCICMKHTLLGMYVSNVPGGLAYVDRLRHRAASRFIDDWGCLTWGPAMASS